MALEQELKYFNEHRLEWLRDQEGKYALVVGTKLEGFYETAAQAYEVGIKAYGNKPMLIHPVIPQETPEQMPVLALLHGYADT